MVRNIFSDLPMHHAFTAGKTDVFSGLAEAARIAHPWQPRSTLLLMLSDGDTVPATGMPKMPASVADVLIVGVGDPRQGSFIDGRMSRQDASTLRQIAARLGGVYHDGNTKHISTATLNQMTVIPRKSAFERLRAREYALIACGLGATVLALLPVLLHRFGTRWRPGVPRSEPAKRSVAGRTRCQPGPGVSQSAVRERTADNETVRNERIRFLPRPDRVSYSQCLRRVFGRQSGTR